MKVPSFLASNRRAIVSILSLLAISKSGNAVEATKIQALETKESFSPNQTASKESLKACVRHPKVARYFCAGASTITECSEKYPRNRFSNSPRRCLTKLLLMKKVILL